MTTKKLGVLVLLTSPIPPSKNPVTVSCITKMNVIHSILANVELMQVLWEDYRFWFHKCEESKDFSKSLEESEATIFGKVKK